MHPVIPCVFMEMMSVTYNDVEKNTYLHTYMYTPPHTYSHTYNFVFTKSLYYSGKKLKITIFPF